MLVLLLGLSGGVAYSEISRMYSSEICQPLLQLATIVTVIDIVIMGKVVGT